MAVLVAGVAHAELRAHSLFSDNMVLQRGKPVNIWGWAEPGESITVTFDGQTKTTKANDNAEGKWSVLLDPMTASSTPNPLIIKGESGAVECKNVLVGDVWLCGGQSNMEHDLHSIYDGDIEMMSANFPNIRLMTVPKLADLEPQVNFTPLNEFNSWVSVFEEKGSWKVCSPETVGDFAGIGYIFGRRIHMATGVPIALIDLSVGGTTIETWTSLDALQSIPGSEGPLGLAEASRAEEVAGFDPKEDLEERIEGWKHEIDVREHYKMGPVPAPTALRSAPTIEGNEPGAYYNGMVAPLHGLTAKGIIFNQGHNNAEAHIRPKFYANAFKAMVGDWREDLGDSNLPFGIIAFVSGGQAQTLDNFELMMVDAAPYVREAQQRAYTDLDNMGFTAAYDQQSSFYHPHDKVQLGERMARWALGTQYDVHLGYKPARLLSAEKTGNRYILTFDRDLQLAHENIRPIEGMGIAGSDQRFYPANARFVVKGKDQWDRDELDHAKVEVWSDFVGDPKAVRYAWARNPLGNLANWSHMERVIALPSFRTDNWPIPFGPESEAMKDSRDSSAWREQMNELRKVAREQIVQRKRQEAELLYKNTRE